MKTKPPSIITSLLLSYSHMVMMGFPSAPATHPAPLFDSTMLLHSISTNTQPTPSQTPSQTHGHSGNACPCFFFFTTFCPHSSLITRLFFFLIALCSLPMSIFNPAFTRGVREMTRLGRHVHLHGNHMASLYCPI